ncbi:MAG: hypothetical protein ACIAXF_16035 [Phycisphaerales bacterium JB063]
MLIDLPTEQMILVVAEMSRQRCVDEIARVPHIPLDFTEGYLNALSIEQLRHLVFAALLQARRRDREIRAASVTGLPAA